LEDLAYEQQKEGEKNCGNEENKVKFGKQKRRKTSQG
jgi:hypothetical protein